MDKRLLLLIVIMAVALIAGSACEQTVRTKCDDSMDYRIEAYNNWVDEYNLTLEAGEPECEKVTRKKKKKPWPKSAYNFYQELMSEYCCDVPAECQLDPDLSHCTECQLDPDGQHCAECQLDPDLPHCKGNDIDASKSAIQDCFWELLQDAEFCYTFSVECQMSLTDWLNSPEGGCLTLEE